MGLKRRKPFTDPGGDTIFPHEKYARTSGTSNESNSVYSYFRDSSGRLPIELKEYVASLAADITNTDDATTVDELGSKCMIECKGYETILCCDPDSSRHLESICRASVSTCLRYFGQLFMNKRKTMINAFTKAVGSCCIESLLYYLRNRLINDQSESFVDSVCEVLMQFGELLLEEFDALVACKQSTYLIRAFGRICCGLGKPDRHGGVDGISNSEARTSTGKDDTLKECLLSRQKIKSDLMALMTRVLDWQSMHGYYSQMSISCLVQEYIELESMAGLTTSGQHVAQLLDCAFKDDFANTIEEHWTNKQASRVWESLLQHCPDHYIDDIYLNHLQGHLIEYATHPISNFPLQRLVERAMDKKTLGSIVDELLPVVDQLWLENRSGVLLAMVSSCAKRRARQKTLRKALVAAVTSGHRLGEAKYGHVIRLLIQCTSYGTMTSNGEDSTGSVSLSKGTITTHGSVILQHLLHFRKPTYFEKGLLQLSADEISTLACHPAGSHVFDAFFSSETVSTQADLTDRLKDPSILIPLSCDKYGSRVVETAWTQRGASVDLKADLARVLTSDKAMTSLSRTPYGKILWSKYMLQKFKASPKEWIKELGGLNQKKRKLMDLVK